jgi:hypothetical protein
MKELKVKKVKLLFNNVITTFDRYTQEDCKLPSGLYDTTLVGALKPYQTVVCVGPQVKPEITVGSLVKINPSRYEVRSMRQDTLKASMDEHYRENVKYKFNVIELDSIPHLFIGDNDIEYVIEEWEEIEPSDSKLILPNNNIITP